MSADLLPPSERKLVIPRGPGLHSDAIGTYGQSIQEEGTQIQLNTKESDKWRKWTEEVIDTRITDLTWRTKKRFGNTKTIPSIQAIEIFDLLSQDQRVEPTMEMLWLHTPNLWPEGSFAKWLKSDMFGNSSSFINKEGEVLVTYQDIVDSLFSNAVLSMGYNHKTQTKNLELGLRMILKSSTAADSNSYGLLFSSNGKGKVGITFYKKQYANGQGSGFGARRLIDVNGLSKSPVEAKETVEKIILDAINFDKNDHYANRIGQYVKEIFVDSHRPQINKQLPPLKSK